MQFKIHPDRIRAQERQRVADVFASDESRGREGMAARLLANPKLEAPEILSVLAETPRPMGFAR